MGSYSVLVNCQSLLSILFHKPFSPIIFLYNILNTLLFVDCIELWNSKIYRLVDRRTEILPLATFHIARLFNQFNHVFALLVSMPRFKSIKFYLNRPKIKLILQQHSKFFGAGGFASTPPKQPLLQFSGYALDAGIIIIKLKTTQKYNQKFQSSKRKYCITKSETKYWTKKTKIKCNAM